MTIHSLKDRCHCPHDDAWTSTPSSSCLSSEDSTFTTGSSSATTSTTSSSSHILQHWSIFQHVRKDHESNLGSSNVDVLKLSNSSISIGNSDTGHLTIHVILSLIQLSSINLASGSFHSDNMALSLVQNLNRNTDYRHFCFFLFVFTAISAAETLKMCLLKTQEISLVEVNQ